MIRRLKVGEIIREGDFATSDNTAGGEKEGINTNIIGKIHVSWCTYPIFREIPDEHVSTDNDGASYTFNASYQISEFTKETIKARALWLLEVAEFIEMERNHER